jgi:hypothetical protein
MCPGLYPPLSSWPLPALPSAKLSHRRPPLQTTLARTTRCFRRGWAPPSERLRRRSAGCWRGGPAARCDGWATASALHIQLPLEAGLVSQCNTHSRSAVGQERARHSGGHCDVLAVCVAWQDMAADRGGLRMLRALWRYSDEKERCKQRPRDIASTRDSGRPFCVRPGSCLAMRSG